MRLFVQAVRVRTHTCATPARGCARMRLPMHKRTPALSMFSSYGCMLTYVVFYIYGRFPLSLFDAAKSMPARTTNMLLNSQTTMLGLRTSRLRHRNFPFEKSNLRRLYPYMVLLKSPGFHIFAQNNLKSEMGLNFSKKHRRAKLFQLDDNHAHTHSHKSIGVNSCHTGLANTYTNSIHVFYTYTRIPYMNEYTYTCTNRNSVRDCIIRSERC